MVTLHLLQTRGMIVIYLNLINVSHDFSLSLCESFSLSPSQFFFSHLSISTAFISHTQLLIFLFTLSLTHSFSPSLFLSLTFSLTYSFSHSFFSLAHSFSCSLVLSLTLSLFIHILTGVLPGDRDFRGNGCWNIFIRGTIRGAMCAKISTGCTQTC